MYGVISNQMSYGHRCDVSIDGRAFLENMQSQKVWCVKQKTTEDTVCQVKGCPFGHPFTNNPVHRSEAKMCGGGRIS